MLRVLSLDPGVTSGYVKADIYNHDKTVLHVGEKKMNCAEMFIWLQDYKPDVIICEDFVYRPGYLPGLEMYSRNLIGVVQLYHELPALESVDWRSPKVVIQQPGIKDAYFKDNEKLKELGVYARGKNHGRDATRHFLYWHNFKGGIPHNNKLGYELVIVS